MANSERTIPDKLRHDAIVESVLEVRFDAPKSAIPEILIGRLADYGAWSGFDQMSMPVSQIPAPVRQADPNLRYQPLMQLVSPAKDRVIRIGPHTLSSNRLGRYVGWEVFRPEIREAVDCLFAKAPDVIVHRLGLRYINALRADLHTIKSISDLDMRLNIANEDISGNVNINFTVDIDDNSKCTVRIATPEFVQGDVPPATSVYIDVDIFTLDGFRTKDKAEVNAWIDFAHKKEKEQFFRLLPQRTIEQLEEK
jgi:uncharacterized protein (TIGR04255 family)